MTNNLRFIGVNTLKNISDAIREKVGRKDPIAPGKWEETLMPYNYNMFSFDQNTVHYCRAISPTENFANNQSIMFLTGNNFLDGGTGQYNMSNMFYNCKNLYGSPKCPKNTTNMYYTYTNCRNLTGSPVCGPNVTNMYSTYSNCWNLTGSPVCGPNVVGVMRDAYSNCHNLTGSPVCGPNVTSIWVAYADCYNLTGRPVCGPNVADMGSAYRNCRNLTGSPVCGPKVTTMSYTYSNCVNLDRNGYIDAKATCNFVNAFLGYINIGGPNEDVFNLILGSNVNASNINGATFGSSSETFSPFSGSTESFEIRTAEPSTGKPYVKIIKGDPIYISNTGNIRIFRENNSQGGGL